MEKNTVESNITPDEDIVEQRGFFSRLFTWVPTSPGLLQQAERKILSRLKAPYKTFFVKAGKHSINTLVLGKGPPLVLVHGFGGGIGLWISNLDDLAKHYTVYAFDLLGFGRSSRPKFTGKTMADSENFFLDSFESWREQLNLTGFTLLGHSLGGYLSACYCLKDPKHVSYLILADPWGIPKKPETSETNLPLKWRLLGKTFSLLNSPLSALRAAGPYGPGLISKFRPDLSEKWSHLFTDDTLENYIYHLCANPPSGEVAFKELSIPFGWAKNPLCNRLPSISKELYVLFIYGRSSWMDPSAGYEVKRQLGDEMSQYVLLSGGHHVYADNWSAFNEVVIQAGKGTLNDYLDSKTKPKKKKQKVDSVE